MKVKAFFCAMLVSALSSGAAFAADIDEQTAGAPQLTGEAVEVAAVPNASGSPNEHRLNLTDDQVEKLQKLKLQYQTSAAGKKAQLKVLHLQLKDAMTQSTIDKAAILGLQSQINSLHAEISNARVSMQLETANVFTPEQREQMRRRFLMRSTKGGAHGKHRHGHRHPQGGRTDKC